MIENIRKRIHGMPEKEINEIKGQNETFEFDLHK